MSGDKKPERFTPPLMYAFRAAFREHDARKTLDLKDESGERIIASRRISPRNIVNQTVLKDELGEDIVSLLHTINMESCEDVSQLQQVRRAILNYGLLEGAAFLAARVQLKIRHEFPEFTGNLLDQLVPHYLAPIPSAMLVRIDPPHGEPSLADGLN